MSFCNYRQSVRRVFEWPAANEWIGKLFTEGKKKMRTVRTYFYSHRRTVWKTFYSKFQQFYDGNYKKYPTWNLEDFFELTRHFRVNCSNWFSFSPDWIKTHKTFWVSAQKWFGFILCIKGNSFIFISKH